MNKILKEKSIEALSSVLPITLIVLLLSITITPMPVGTLVLYLVGAVLLIVGMAFFSLGTDVSMTPMGEGIGAQLPRTKNLLSIVGITFIIGILITIAEPDLQVLAGQVPSIPNAVLIWTVAVGVGLFFVLAMLRTLFKIRLASLLILFYIGVLVLSAFVPNEFVAVAFDSGGVTTGPITVPFIMALGIGLASIRGDRDAQDDSFGLVALCSIGPILAVIRVTLPLLCRRWRILSRWQCCLPTICQSMCRRFYPPCFRSFCSAQFSSWCFGAFIGCS